MNNIERWLIWRRRNGLSQTAAGQLFGVSRGMIRRIERGEVSPLRFVEERELPLLASPGEELWLLRRKHALGLAEAAYRLDCSRTTLWLLEADRADIVGRDLTDIERAYREISL
jgi:DNA-binding XRE family transcriptional regulator